MMVSWKGVAAAAVGAGVGGAVRAEIGGQLGEGFGAKLMTGVLAGMAAGVAVGALRGGRFSMQQVAVDAFGNALGSSIADAMSSPSAADNRTALNRANQASDPDYYSPVAETPDQLAAKRTFLFSAVAGPRASSGAASGTATRDQVFAGGVNGSLAQYFKGLDGVPNPSALPLADAFIGLNGGADRDGYKNFHQALNDIGINGRNAGQSAVYLVQPGMSEAAVLGDIRDRLGTGFSQQLDKSPEVQAYLADRVSGAKVGQLINITDFWQSAVGDTVQRAYKHPGGDYFRDVIDNGGTIPIASKMLGGFNFNSIVAQDDLAPPAYRDYAARSLGVDAAAFLASTFMPVNGLGAALRGKVSMLEGRLGFAGLAESVTRINLLATPSKGGTFESLFYETTGLSKYAGPKMPGTLPTGATRNTVPDLVQPGNAPVLPGITDLKNVGVLSMDSQLMAQQSIAKSTGVPFNVVVAPNTQIYSSVVKATTGSGGNVYVWNPLTKAFTPYRP